MMPMQKDHFIDPQSEDWWLVAATLDSALEARRLELGRAWGWNHAGWYTESSNLVEVYTWVADNRSDLLEALDYAEDVSRQLKWLEDLLESVQAAEQEGQEAESEEDDVGGQASAGATANGQTAAPAEPKKSIFAKKPVGGNKAEEEESEEEGEAPQAAAPQPGAPPQAGESQAEAPQAGATDQPALTSEQLVENLQVAAADPDIQVDEKQFEEIANDPAAQEELAKLMEQLAAETENEAEQELQALESEDEEETTGA
jgi:hypothetical protein